MQPPLPSNTLLQSRYQIKKLLGQGGFGRTYLAEDQGRFNEMCVLKEYIPSTGGDYALQKSKELFHREAQTLYQLHHPQVPELHSTFEEGNRLFLVQDYIEGPTYRRILEQRLANQQVFSEGEAFEFLQQMLPVLEYIHSKGIIHRDIAPDNIIFRKRDSLPVLIDFGIVKEIAQGQPLEEEGENATTVGKLGYAPSEQLQTGKIYPSSDLYALAVTTVVLLTGRKSQDLKDEESMNWRWQQWLPSLTPQFAQILNRMLSSKPRNRYQTAADAAQALRTLTGLVPPAAGPRTLTTAFMTPRTDSKLQPSLGQISAPSQVSGSLMTKNRTGGSIIFKQEEQPEFKFPDWGWPALGLGVAMAGILALTQIQQSTVVAEPSKPTVAAGNLRNPPRTPVGLTPILQTPVTTPDQTPDQQPVAVNPTPETPGAAETPAPATGAEISTQPVNFSADVGRLQMGGRVDSNRVQRYPVTLLEGQKVAARILKGDAATLHIRNGNKSLETGVTAWQSPVNTSPGTVQIDVEAKAPTDYLLELSVSAK